MHEDEHRAVPRPGAERALDLRGRQAAARAGDLGARPARRPALHDRAPLQRASARAWTSCPGVDGEGIPRVLACFMGALLRGSRCRWSTADGSGDPSSTSTSSSTAWCASSSGPRRLPGQILNLGNPRNDVTIRALGRALAAALPHGAAAARRAAARVGQRRGSSTDRATTTPRRGSRRWRRRRACSAGARVARSRRCCRRSSAIIWRDTRRFRRPAPASPRQPAGAGDEAGRGRAGLQRRPPPAGRGRAHRRPTRPRSGPDHHRGRRQRGRHRRHRRRAGRDHAVATARAAAPKRTATARR